MRYAAILLLFTALLGCAQQQQTGVAPPSTNSRPTGLDLQAALADTAQHALDVEVKLGTRLDDFAAHTKGTIRTGVAIKRNRSFDESRIQRNGV